MAKTVSDFVWERLAAWGIRRVFGYPGDGINGLVGALGRADMEFVQARHEELAAFMACGHAKYTGEVGVCLATSGPGAIHLLNGLYDAQLDHQPVLAIVGQADRAAMGAHYQQEVDLTTLFKDVAGDYVQVAMTPAQVPMLIDRAIRIAKAERTVTALIFPKDVQEMDAVEEMPRKHGFVHSGIGYAPPRVLPADEDLRRAAEVLNAGKRVAMLVGAGTLRAGDEVLQVADALGAGVAKALLGKAAVPDDLPFVTGSIGLLGTRPSYEMMTRCDTLLMVGSRFPYSEFLPEPGQARGVQIDLDPKMLNIRYPMEVALVGDSAATLRALLPLLERKSDRSWREEIEANVAEWWKVREARAMMGAAVPYAIAAKFAHPDRPVVALVGDGAMQMNGMNGLITVAKYWKQWTDPRLVVLVLNNRDLNQVTWEMRAQSGDPKLEASQDLPDVRYADYAKLLGLGGIFVDDPDKIGPAWDEAFRADRPVVVEAYTDPNVPPLPPHITLQNVKALMSTLWQGDPDQMGLVRETAKQVLADYLPGRK